MILPWSLYLRKICNHWVQRKRSPVHINYVFQFLFWNFCCWIFSSSFIQDRACFLAIPCFKVVLTMFLPMLICHSAILSLNSRECNLNFFVVRVSMITLKWKKTVQNKVFQFMKFMQNVKNRIVTNSSPVLLLFEFELRWWHNIAAKEENKNLRTQNEKIAICVVKSAKIDSVKGYHVYRNCSEPGDILTCTLEPQNKHSRNAFNPFCYHQALKG